MSRGSIDTIMKRIKGATKASQITVLKCYVPGVLDAVFTSTVETQKLIKQKHPDIVGTYDRTMDKDVVKNDLHLAVRRYETVIDMPYEPKSNSTLFDDWALLDDVL